MTYEKWGIFFISLLVLVIASFSVVGALAMLIVDKRRDIVTLRALGADTSLVRAIFRSEGFAHLRPRRCVRALLGVGLSLLQQHFGLIEIPAETLLAKSYPSNSVRATCFCRAGGLRPCRLYYFEHYRAQHGET